MHARRTRRLVVVTLAAGSLVLTACGGELADSLSEAARQAEEALDSASTEDGDSSQDDSADDGADGDDRDGADGSMPFAFEDRDVDTTVHYNGIDYTVQRVRVLDEVEQTVMNPGASFAFDLRFTNRLGENRVPASRYTLRWEHGEDVYEATGSVVAGMDAVPGGGSNSGEIVITISASQMETFDLDNAVLQLGETGRNPSRAALGPNAETVTKFPIRLDPPDTQMEFTGEAARSSIDVVGTITHAEVRWFRGQDRQHLPDGKAILLIEYELVNQGEAQASWSRSSGAWSITQPNGNSTVDAFTSTHFVAVGDTITVTTAFEIDDPFVGDHVLTFEMTRTDSPASVTLTIDTHEGQPAS